MKKRNACKVLLSILLLLTLAGCSGPGAQPAGESGAAVEPDMQPILDSYYVKTDDPTFAYLQNSSLTRFYDMWVEEVTGITAPRWNYGRAAQYRILDDELAPVFSGQTLYCLPFSDGKDRYGYVVVQYHGDEDGDGPSVSNMDVVETTPEVYDLEANLEKIRANLEKTDLDLKTASALRAAIADAENHREREAILFTDETGGQYVCYLDTPDFRVVKFPPENFT